MQLISVIWQPVDERRKTRDCSLGLYDRSQQRTSRQNWRITYSALRNITNTLTVDAEQESCQNYSAYTPEGEHRVTGWDGADVSRFNESYRRAACINLERLWWWRLEEERASSEFSVRSPQHWLFIRMTCIPPTISYFKRRYASFVFAATRLSYMIAKCRCPRNSTTSNGADEQDRLSSAVDCRQLC